MERKKPENVVPHPFDKLFAGYDFFNDMQSTMLDDLLHSDKSIVLSAPTGSGKTVAFELAIIRMLQNAQIQWNDNNNNLPKAIYIAPIKALCNEKFNDWKPRFESMNVNCIQLTGDTESTNFLTMRQAQVIISTPEKWDSLTRRWRDFEQLLPAVQLFIVDEVHLLNEDTRGPILEAVIARMKSSGVKRFVMASATIPNVEDLTSWISGNDNVINVAQHVFSEMLRPVPLEKIVIGFNSKLKGFQFDMRLNYQLPDILRKYAEDKASLVFCNSRKSAEMAAFNLNKTSAVFSLKKDQKNYLIQLAPRLTDVKLRKLVENGIAYHHAGLQYADRTLIEAGFRQGFLMVLISTSTLAMGINLPAHLVVIKSTENYQCGGYVEYPENMMLQMIGRAGRPQYDTKGVAVILTQQKNVKKYQTLMNGQAPIESHLHKHLTEHLNSEIALNTITNLEIAMNWIRSTYLYVRSVRNPKHYGFDAKLAKVFVEHKLEELCLRQIKALNSAGLVTFNPLTGSDVQITTYGKLMAKYYLCFETMKVFQQLNGKESLEDLLNLIVQCKEMNEFTLRVNEKKALNEMNKAPIRFPIKGRIKTSEEKISCIIQAVLGNIEITAPSLLQESLKIMRISDRISKSLLEYVRLSVNQNERNSSECGWYSAMLNAFFMAKCLHAKLWENSEFASKQLQGIGTVYSECLAKFGKTTLKSIARTEARTLEHLLNKSAPFGDKILEHLMTFPEYELTLERKSKNLIQVCVKQINENYVYKNGATAVLILGDSFNQILILEENLNNIIMNFGIFERTFKLNKADVVEQIYGHVIHLSLVGVDAYTKLAINTPKNMQLEGNASFTPKKQTLLNVTLNENLKNISSISDESFNMIDNLQNETMLQNISNSNKKHQKNHESLTLPNNKPTQSLENFCFNKPKMRSYNIKEAETLGDTILNETQAQQASYEFSMVNDNDLNITMTTNEVLSTNNLETSGINFDMKTKIDNMKTICLNETKKTNEITKIDNLLNKTTKTDDDDLNIKTANRFKQCKLTDFFIKRKQAQKSDDITDLTKSLKLILPQTHSSIKVVDDIENTNKPQNRKFINQELIPENINPKRKIKLNKEKSNTSSSGEIPLTVIPNPKKRQIVPVNNNIYAFKENTQFQFNTSKTCAKQRGPFTLMSFLADPDELNKSEPMIKLPTNSNKQNITKILKEKPYNINKAIKKKNPFEEIDMIKEMLFENRAAQNFVKTNKEYEKAQKINFMKTNDFQFSNFEENENSLISCEMYEIPNEIEKQQNTHKIDTKTKLLLESNNKISNNFKVENLSEKFIQNECLLGSFHSSSPLTQDSPIDLSKTEHINKKQKLQDTATQVNLKTEIKKNEHPTAAEFELWHKVALEFRRLPPLQLQSINFFEKTYEKVRQREINKFSSINTTRNVMGPPLNIAFNSSSNNLENPTHSKTKNSSNLKIKNCSTFRLQLFDNNDDEEKVNAELKAKLKRREIKLINENVMNLVLERKCKQISVELNHAKKISNELDKLELELGIHVDHDDFVSVKNINKNGNDNVDHVGDSFFK